MRDAQARDMLAATRHAGPLPLRPALGWVVFAVALAAAMVSAIYVRMDIVVSNVLFVDWYTYAHAVDRVLRGAPLYAPQQLAGPYGLPDVSGVGFAYPPSAILLLAPFASWPVGAAVWMILNIGALITGVAAVLRREFGRLDPLSLAACTFVLALFLPFGVGFATLNVNVGLAGLYAWAWALQDSRALGPLIGAAGALKMLPFMAVGVAAPNRRIGTIVAAGAVAFGLVLVSLPAMGVATWQHYVLALSNAVPACGTLPSVACVLAPLGVAPAKAAGIALAGGAFLVSLLVRSRLLAYVLVALAWLAPVTDMQWHYLLILYVLLVVVVARVLASRRAHRLAGVMLGATPSQGSQ